MTYSLLLKQLLFHHGCIMTSCGFKTLVSSPCGSSKYQKRASESIVLLNCNKDIKGHLKRLNTFDTESVKSEATLILARAGIFNVDNNHLYLTICPRHRDEYGIKWLTNKRNCACPSDWAPHKSTARKGDRGITLEQSRLLYDLTSTILPVGSPICKRCRLLLGKTKTDSAVTEGLSEAAGTSVLDTSSDQEVSYDVISEPSTSYLETSSETVLCEKLEEMVLSPNQSLYSPDNGSSSEHSSSESTTGRDLSTRRNLLNTFLVSSGVESVTQSKKKFSSLMPRTKATHVSKASESIAAMLDVIAPGDAGALWEATKKSNMVEKALSIKELDSTEKVYLQALAETYQHATGWDTRRQILSIMADLVPFSKLQEYIPGITYYRVKTARHHKQLYGRGAAVIDTRSPRMRVDQNQLDHFLTFITSPHVVQDLPFGQRNLQLSNGQAIETPNVIRTMVKERTIRQYTQYCEETHFKPFGYSTMYRILTSCSAAVRKSLQGLDYISAEGGKAFDDLLVVVDKLIDHGLDPRIGMSYQKTLKQGKQYLKTDYKVHVAQSSSTADHCLLFALSDSKETAIQHICDHAHDEFCQSCEQLKSTLQEIGEQIKCLCQNDDDLLYVYRQAVQATESWKAHLLRTVQQDKARTDVMEILDENSVLIIQDWAMKFLPQKFREHQRDWFGKRGISWHISVVVRKVQGNIEHQTLIHIVKNSPQESDTVIWIMEHVLETMRQDHPEISTAYFRQDNAGCYHSVSVVVVCPKISENTGIHIKRVDFSDPQGGKGACDRKAATVKGHVRRYINEGHDVEAAEDFKNAILSYGGLAGVRVALVDNPQCRYDVQGKWDGISSLNNFSFDENGKTVTVWKSYDIGKGRKVLWSKLPVQIQVREQMQTTITFSSGDFIKTLFAREPSNDDYDEDSNGDEEEGIGSQDDNDDQVSAPSSDELFSCPSQGCVLSFKRHSNLESHLTYGKCKLRKEKLTLLDKAKILYTQKLAEGTSAQPLMCSITTESQSGATLCQGWALRQQKKSGRFNDNQRSYLDEKFLIGQASGIKCDPSQVARDLRHARTDSGEHRFTIDEFLTAQQVKSYFSRKALKNKKASAKDQDIDALSAEEHMAYSSARDSIIKEIELNHPILYDTYNICRLYNENRLAKLSVALLRHICTFFNMDVEGLSHHRKAPYLSLINDLVQSCSCSK